MKGRLTVVSWTGGQLDLGLLGGFLESLYGHLVGRQVDTLGVLEGLDQPLHDRVVPVVTTEVGVAVGGLHLEDAVGDVEHRHVEGATTEVEHEDRLLLAALVEAVGQRRGGGLVHDAQHLEAGDLTGFLGRGALGVVEVGRHGDDGLGDGVTEVGLRVALELLEDARRDLLGGVLGAVDVDGPVLTHVALDRTNGALGIGDGLTLGHLADEYLAGLRESNDRRRRTTTLGVRNNDGLSRLQH